MFVLVFLALGVAGASAAWTNDVIAVASFTLVWMTSAITRLAELRRGARPAIRLSRVDRQQAVTFAVGSGAWVVLGVLQSAYASSIVWKPIGVPLPLRALGIVLAAAVIAEPFLLRVRTFAAEKYQFSASVIVRGGAILLLSGSPVFALMCVLWLGVAAWPRAASAAESWRLRPAAASTGYADRVDNAIPAPLA